MSVRERLTVKIDLKDAFLGGTAIYVSVLLVSYLMIFLTDIFLRFTNMVTSDGQFVTSTGIISDNLYGIFIAVMLSIFLITFFLVVLFDENLFSKHEKGLVDLLGLGLVWGLAFIAIDTLIETFLMYVAMFRSWDSLNLFSMRGLLFDAPYWIAVIYIITLPAAIYYLRLNHKQHMEKIK